jgi:hypothetical protein
MQESSIREREVVEGLDQAGSIIELGRDAAKSVNQILRDAVITGFAHFGNKNVVDSLLYILELEHAVDINGIADNIQSFQKGIVEMFGTGAYVLEDHVCEELARRMGIDRNNRDLQTLVSLLKENIGQS